MNRPPLSMPKAAINALLYVYLLIGSIPAILLMVLPQLLHSNRDFLNDYFLVYLLIVGGWLLTLLFVVRSGRLIGLHLFRSTAFLLTAMLLIGLAAAALVAFGIAGDGTHDARLGGQFGVGAFLICTPVLWLLLRALKRVRWLDPTSAPEEWEPPVKRNEVFLKTMTRKDPGD